MTTTAMTSRTTGTSFDHAAETGPAGPTSLADLPVVGDLALEILANPHVADQALDMAVSAENVASPYGDGEDAHLFALLEARRLMRERDAAVPGPGDVPAAFRRALERVRPANVLDYDVARVVEELLAPGVIEALARRGRGGERGLATAQAQLKRRLVDHNDDLPQAQEYLAAILAMAVEPAAAHAPPPPDPADEYRPFPTRLLPGPVAAFVAEVAASKMVDEAVVAIAAVASLGARSG